MLVQFECCRVIGSGVYEIKNISSGRMERYPWVELAQRAEDLPDGYPVRQPTEAQRFSVETRRDEDGNELGPASLIGCEFGLRISGTAEVSDETKVIKGTDRSVDKTKFKVVAWHEVDAAGQPVESTYAYQPAEAEAV